MHLPRQPSPWIWAVFSLYCDRKYPWIFALHPDKPVRAKSCMHEPVQRPRIAFIKKGPSILRQLGNCGNKQERQVFSCKVAPPCSASSRVWAQQTRLRLCAAAWFSRLCSATFVMVTRARLEKKLWFTGERDGMPAFIIILIPSERAWYSFRWSIKQPRSGGVDY